MVVHIRADQMSHEARHPGNPLGYLRCALTRPDKPVLRGARTPRFRGAIRDPKVFPLVAHCRRPLSLLRYGSFPRKHRRHSAGCAGPLNTGRICTSPDSAVASGREQTAIELRDGSKKRGPTSSLSERLSPQRALGRVACVART